MPRDGCVRWPGTGASDMIPRARPCAACRTGTAVAAMLVLGARGAAGFQAIPATPWTSRSSHVVSRAAAVEQRSLGASRVPCARYRWMLKSETEENRGAGEGGVGGGSVGSDEKNNWGMDDSIDVDAIRMKMMEKAGYAKRGDSDAGDEWITVDESNMSVDKMKDALAGSLRSDLAGNEALQGADVSKLVEDILEDTDMAKFFDEEFEKGTSALRALADELKTEQGTASYADTMAQELAELLQAEEEKAEKEIEQRRGPAKAKLDKATAELEEAMADAQKAQQAFEGDALLQLLSFRKKGVLRQAAFVGAILIANQAVYQAILVADDRGGSPEFALGGLVVSAGLVWFYGFRPFSL